MSFNLLCKQTFGFRKRTYSYLLLGNDGENVSWFYLLELISKINVASKMTLGRFLKGKKELWWKEFEKKKKEHSTAHEKKNILQDTKELVENKKFNADWKKNPLMVLVKCFYSRG